MKRIFAVFLILTILLAACGKTETSTAAVENTPLNPAAAQDPAAAQLAETPAPSFSGQDVLFPPADHPPLGETVSGGGERMTAYGIARMEAVHKDYYAFWDYYDKNPDSALRTHCAGAFSGGLDVDWALVIRLDDPENKECLEEIAEIGLKTDYRIGQGVGTEARLTVVKAEIDAKLEALRAAKADGSISKDAASLLGTYQPEVWVFRDEGIISVILSCKSIYYGSTGAEQTADRAKAIALFEEYVGKYDVVRYGYPV